MIPAESIYKKARELFGVQNNYNRSLLHFEVLKIDLGYYRGNYDGKNFYIGSKINNFVATRAGIPEGIFQCFLLPESVNGIKDDLRCILRIERDEGPEVIFGNEKGVRNELLFVVHSIGKRSIFRLWHCQRRKRRA